MARAGSGGTILVIDRELKTRNDRRLVAHIAADEPPENAMIASRCYLSDARAGGGLCRRLTSGDLRRVRLFERLEEDSWDATALARAAQLERPDARFALELFDMNGSLPALRWSRRRTTGGGESAQAISLRQVIGELERYEPALSVTRRTLKQVDAGGVSATTLRAELWRVLESPIVLNRPLRERVLAAVEREEASMSEIAMRCGRVKRDSTGNESGETSWLGRRLGVLPEGGRQTRTPWIHSDVLALIARRGLGISPREVGG